LIIVYASIEIIIIIIIIRKDVIRVIPWEILIIRVRGVVRSIDILIIIIGKDVIIWPAV
jgi:hypothetical protein